MSALDCVFTAALVAIGMKNGVAKFPCGVCNSPLRPFGVSALSLNISNLRFNRFLEEMLLGPSRTAQHRGRDHRYHDENAEHNPRERRIKALAKHDEDNGRRHGTEKGSKQIF